MRALLIEDNKRLANLVREGVTIQGMAVDLAFSLADARALLSVATYDIILLDLSLPDGDGLDLVRWLRHKPVATPVLVITARDAVGERVLGLDAGADDYLPKPFDMAELKARCRALLRRPGHCLGTQLRAGNVTLDCARRVVHVAQRLIDISPRECSLLDMFMRNTGRVVTRSAIDASLYALGAEVTPNAVEVAISRLRRRLAGAGANVEIHTAHGIGYVFMPSGDR